MAGTPDPALLEQLRADLGASYDIEREMTGGMSRVFMATDRTLGRKVVIKVLPPELTAGVNRDRFRREIQFAARLQHPHIVPLLTAGQLGDILYYTMPLVEGETLRSRLEREGRLPPASVMAILQDVVDALAYAHARGLVHRDIKPENILLQRHHALLTDFGVAKAITEALPGIGATTAGIAVGTPAYMAPEQLAADPAADHRVDLYAIGLLAYELLSGSSPFTGSSPQQTLARQLTEQPTPPHLTRADVPPALSGLIMRCLEKDPAARWGSADELLQALSDIRITASIGAITPTERLAAVVPRRRRSMVWVALPAVGVAAVLVWSRWGRNRVTTNLPEAAVVMVDSTPAIAAPTPPAPAPQLTRADSEAIARSVARRLDQKRAPAAGLSQAQIDSVRSELEKSITDSVMAKLRTGGRGAGIGRTLDAVAELGRVAVQPRFQVTEGHRPYRVVFPDVVDGSADRSLALFATALNDSVTAFVRRRPVLRLFGGAQALSFVRRFDSPVVPGSERGTDALMRGAVRRTGDSVEIVFGLQDTRNPATTKTLRYTMLTDDPAVLSATVVPMIMAWLDSREVATRAERRLRPTP